MTAHELHKRKHRFDAGATAVEVLAESKGNDWRAIFVQFPASFALVAKEAPDALRTTLRRASREGGKAWASLFTTEALGHRHSWVRPWNDEDY
jgi:hypothetical protein